MTDNNEMERCMAVAEGELFRGIDRIVGEERLSPAVTGSTAPRSGMSQTTIQMVVGENRMQKAAELSGGFGVSVAGLFDVGASAGGSRSTSMTTYGVSVVVEVYRPIVTLEGRAVQLKEGVTSPQSPSETGAFVREHGDSYVSSVTVGGRCWVNFILNATSKEHQDVIKGKVEVSGVIKVVGVSADLAGRLETVSRESNASLRVEFGQSGVSGHAPEDLTDPKSLLQYTAQFMKHPVTAPEVLSYSTTGYSRVPNFGAFHPVTETMDTFFDPYGYVYQASVLSRMYEQILLIFCIYNHYGGFQDPDLTRRFDVVKQDLDKMKAVCAAYRKDPAQPVAALELPSLSYGMPEPNIRYTNGDKFGGESGGFFDDTEGVLFPRIEEVKMWSPGNFIDRIDVTYSCLQLDGSTTKCTKEHGSNGAGVSPAGPAYYYPENYIQRVEIRSGTRVDNIKLMSVDGRTTIQAGGGGGVHGWNATNNKRLAAFQGRSGDWLDMIQLKAIEFGPVRWTGSPF